jgi:hypothetical protein
MIMRKYLILVLVLIGMAEAFGQAINRQNIDWKGANRFEGLIAVRDTSFLVITGTDTCRLTIASTGLWSSNCVFPGAAGGDSLGIVGTDSICLYSGAVLLNCVQVASASGGVDTIFRQSGVDSIFFTIGGNTYAILDSIGVGGSGGLVDSVRVIQDSILVVYSGGSEQSRDTIRVSGLGDTLWERGSGLFSVQQISDNQSIASGDYSTASGIVGTASGFVSKVWGENALASGDNSTAWGIDCQATGGNSTAWGNVSVASGIHSTAFGQEAEAIGNTSTAIGQTVKAKSAFETSLGTFNTDYTPNDTNDFNSLDRILSVGIGQSNATRRNALTILKNGNHGFLTDNPQAIVHIGDSALASDLGILNEKKTFLVKEVKIGNLTPNSGQFLQLAADSTLVLATPSGGGGGGLVDSARILQDSILVVYTGASEQSRDTIRIPSGGGGGGYQPWDSISPTLTSANLNVSIGTTATDGRLTVNGGGTTTANIVNFRNSSGFSRFRVQDNGDIMANTESVFCDAAVNGTQLFRMRNQTNGVNAQTRIQLETNSSELNIRNFSSSYNVPAYFQRRTLIEHSVASAVTQDAVLVIGARHANPSNIARVQIHTQTDAGFQNYADANCRLAAHATGVSINSVSIDASSALDVVSTTRGFLPPRMTTAQRDAIATPAAGLIIYCTDCTANDASTGVPQSYNGSTWKSFY